MRAQEEIGKWQFLPAMLALQSSHNKLTSWCGIQPPGLPVRSLYGPSTSHIFKRYQTPPLVFHLFVHDLSL